MPSEDEATTAALLASVREPERFGAVFDAHHGAIRGYLRHRLGNVDLAEDLAAETFARAFAARARFRDGGGGVRPWLFTIATNLLRDEARRRASGRLLLTRLRRAQPTMLELPEDGDPELRVALRSLRREELDTLLLHVWGELSYAEIATATATRIGTVRSRLHRARAHMSAALKDPTTPPSTRRSHTERTST